MMMPKNGETKSIDPKLIAPDPTFDKKLDKDATLAEKWKKAAS